MVVKIEIELFDTEDVETLFDLIVQVFEGLFETFELNKGEKL